MSFLAKVAQEKELEVARLREGPLPDPHLAPPVRSLAAALSTPGLAAIAEVKRGSPSEGAIRADADAAAIARSYEAAGARAISVLTDGPHFGGSLADLAQVRGAVSLPVLRKDFLIDPIQVLEARTAGADAVLLIVAMLSDAQLQSLLAATRQVGMEALIEVHTQGELMRAVAADARILGVNSRDLSDLSIDLGRTETLLGRGRATAELFERNELQGGIGCHRETGRRRLSATSVDECHRLSGTNVLEHRSEPAGGGQILAVN